MIKRELQITDAIINRAGDKTLTPSFVRVAPVVISDALSLSVEVSLPNGQAARLLGLPSAAAAADVLLHLMGPVRC